MKESKPFKSKQNRIRLIVVLVIGIFCMGSYYLAKYYSQQAKDSTVKAVEIFFTSDLLKEPLSAAEEYDYVIADWTKEDTIRLELRNFPDSKRLTTRDIQYTVEVNDPSAAFEADSSPVSSTNGITEELLLPKDQQKAATIEIKLGQDFLAGTTTGKVAVVKAKATYPYEKELTARFLIEKSPEGFQVIVEDAADSPYAKVTVTTEEKRAFQLTWKSSEVVPDQTNPVFYGQSVQNGQLDKLIDLGEVKDTGSITFYLLKYDESKDYTTNYKSVFDVLEKQGGG
ncbi:hypothetical protein [Enterococcus sp. AZ072]|uniref:hypothetical protein n=1 Tax=unclassified Enterococcus TaxID=2608891 RepID=UPI003D27811E